MSLFKRFFLLGSLLLLAVFCLTISPIAPSAHAASVSASLHGPQHELAWADTHALSMTAVSVSPDFTCPSRTICLFQNDDFTGAVLTCATDVCRGAWFSTTVGGVHAGSVNDNSNSILWTYDKQDNVLACWEPGRHVLSHTYGFFRVAFGVTSCIGAPVPPLP